MKELFFAFSIFFAKILKKQLTKGFVFSIIIKLFLMALYQCRWK
jgi:hypothetical protein